jgi:imidazolonepropionase-like amidohydrolase
MKTLLLSLLLAPTLAAQPIVIRAARVIDGRGHVINDAAVVVDGGKIVRVVTDLREQQAGQVVACG